MAQVVTIGLDIAKSVFQVHGVAADGEEARPASGSRTKWRPWQLA
ncbi:hypothetical protein [Phenylobacterium sp.]|nr:hypothetical protein [Phenylobacterium sp.]MDP2214923.1 hypothetical protein [Phenylobacterium sp.]